MDNQSQAYTPIHMRPPSNWDLLRSVVDSEEGYKPQHLPKAESEQSKDS